MPGGVRVEVHLTAADTGGAFCLLTDELPPGWALPAHTHGGEAETIHVVSGSLEMEVDGEPLRLAPGDTAHVPQGVVHSGRAAGDEPVRRVALFSPGGMEDFFLEAGAESADVEVDLAAMLTAATRHGWDFAAR